jgi:hypothetical protein
MFVGDGGTYRDTLQYTSKVSTLNVVALGFIRRRSVQAGSESKCFVER